MGRRTFFLGLFISILLMSGFFVYSTNNSIIDVTQNEIGDIQPEKETPSSPSDSDEASSFIEILPSDCTNECSAFMSETEKLQYCQSTCGFSRTEPGASTEPLPYQESLERKDAAIKNKDFNACGEITDANLRKSCEVRVTEDLLE